jgi:D-alanyl-lipoteichoic acid acyltransferase DltB (MBOAT superfamily)
MAFSSLHFLFFFPTVLALAWLLRRSAKMRIVFLLAASYYFYMSWNWRYAGLILGSTVLDFVLALRMHGTARRHVRRALLLFSLAGNLGVLCLFKYYNFFVDGVVAVFGGEGAGASYHHSLLLPVGISFYTFQTLSYTIDVYRGRIEPTPSLVNFAFFVSFFPQLVAGPIVRASEFLPQLERKARFDNRAFERGLGRILLGLFKKLCIADVLGMTLVDGVFSDPTQSGSAVLAAMYAYAFQIYYDFSGYSDIAVGAAGMLGFDLPINFDRPYTATSMRDFWRRWHISLSTWLRDYLYIPLGGGRGGAWKTARNLAIVMVLGGLWHGAAWGFVIWGVAHGLLLGCGRVFQQISGVNPHRAGQHAGLRFARMVVTFHLAAACFVVFRAEDWGTVRAFFTTLVSTTPNGTGIAVGGWMALLLAAALEWTPRNWPARLPALFERLPSPAQAGVVLGSLLLFAVMGSRSAPFIYFQF